MNVIQLAGVSRRFGDLAAVQDVSIAVPARSVYAFLGPNGAGKTTTIRLILGLLRADRGEIELFGKSARRYRTEALRRIGSMVEMPSLYPHLTGEENLQVKRRLLGLPQSEVSRVLKIVDLVSASSRLVRGYSLGMRQRLGLALAMLGQPELLILDEPTNGLDPAGIEEMRNLIRSLPESQGMTVFLSSHLLSEVEQVASHAAILRSGRVLFDGTIRELHAQQSNTLVIGVDRPDAAAAHLRQSGFRVERNDSVLQLEGTSLENAAAINATLVQAGFAVHQLSMQRRSLEQIFLEMTTEAK